MSSYYYEHIHNDVKEKINLVSLTTSCLSLILILLLSYFRSFIFNRVTIRFQALITLVDIGRHTILLNIEQPVGALCDFLGFLGFFLDHLYVFINVVMAINIQLLYLFDVKPNKKLECLLLFLVFFLALTLDGIPYLFGAYGQDEYKYCFLKEGKNSGIFRILLIYTTLPPGMIYCLCVFISVIISLHLRKDYIDSKFPDKRMLIGGEVVNARDFVKKLYFRMSFYPVTSFLCFIGFIVTYLCDDFKVYNPEALMIIASISIRSTGIINFISLVADPHFHIAIKSIWLAREEYEYKADLETDVELQTIRDLKKEEPKYYVAFAGRDPLSYEEFIRFI